MVNGQFAVLVNFNIISHLIKRSVLKVFYDVYFFFDRRGVSLSKEKVCLSAK